MKKAQNKNKSLKKKVFHEKPATFNSIIRDIKSLKIQGASQVRKAAVDALKIVVDSSNKTKLNDFRDELKQKMLVLLDSRPTEPGMRGILRIVLHELQTYSTLREAKEHILGKLKNFELERERAMNKISFYGARKIEKDSVVFTACHSHTVEAILIDAFEKGKIKHVYCTETRPLYQGRITAKVLSKAGVPVTYILDSAVSVFMKEADYFFTGADAITENGSLINKIGTNQASIIAEKFSVPHIVATTTHKFDPITVFGQPEKIEERSFKEVWEDKPSKVKIRNPAFDLTPANLISEIITEKGVFSPQSFATFMYHEMKLNEKTEKDLSLHYLLKK